MSIGRSAAAVLAGLFVVIAAVVAGVPLIDETTAQSSTTKVEVGTAEGQPGEEVTVLVWANASNVSNGRVNITFDPSVVEVQSVSAGDLGAATTKINNNIGFVSFSPSGDLTGVNDPVLGEVTFEIVANTTANTSLSLVKPNTTIRDTDGNVIPIDSYVDGEITAIPGIYIPSYSVSATTVERDEPFFVNATVKNNQNVSDSLNVTLYKDGVANAIKTVSVPANSTESVSFNTSFAKAGEHTVTVNDRDPTTVSVLVDKIGVFEFTAPGQVDTGESFVVNATVQNNQAVSDSLNVTLYRDGVANTTKTVSVPANSTKSVTFTTSFATAGKHNVTVNDLEAKTVDVFGPVTIDIGDIDADFGERVTLNLTADAPDVGGYEANITFDPSLVRVRSVSGADFSKPTAKLDNKAGFVSLTQSRTRNPIDRPTLARVTFEVVATSPTNASLSFNTADTALLNITGANIPIAVYNDGSVNITPGIVVTDYAVSNTTVEVNQNFTVNATVRNYQSASDSLNVKLYAGGKVVKNRTVPVGADSTAFAEFNYSFAVAGDRTVRINNRPTTTITVLVDKIGVTGFTVSETEPLINETFFVNATVQNNQGVDDELNVTLYKDGIAATSRTVNVSANANETISFPTSFSQAGVHNVTVNDQPPQTVTAVGPTVVSLEDVTGNFDETVTLDLTVDAQAVAGIEANISFDPDVVQIKGVTAVDFDAASVNIDNENGTFTLTSSQSTDATNPIPVRIRAKIVASKPANTDFTFRPSDTKLFNVNGSVSIDQFKNGSVTVAPGIIATNFTLSNTSVAIGETFTVNATVRNFQNTSDSLNVKLFSEKKVVKNRTVTVGANSKRFVELNYSYASAGRRAVRINSLPSKTVTVNVGTIGIIDVSYSKTDVKVNETFFVNATIQNNQGISDSLNVTLYKDGSAVQTKEVTVPAQSERNVSFQTSFSQGGRFNVSVNNQFQQEIVVRGGTTVVLENVNTSLNSTFTSLLYANATNVNGFETRLRFNSSLLQLKGVSYRVGNLSGLANIDNPNGTVKMQGQAQPGASFDDPVFVELTFEVTGATPTNTTVRFVESETLLFDPQGSPISIALFDNGQVSISGIQPGDVNGDGSINTGDVIRIQRDIVGLSPGTGYSPAAADVNNDGNIDTGDVINVQRFIVGLPSVLD